MDEGKELVATRSEDLEWPSCICWEERRRYQEVVVLIYRNGWILYSHSPVDSLSPQFPARVALESVKKF